MDPERLFDTNFLIGRAQSGDEQAVDALYRRYIRRVESWTRGRVPSPARNLHDTHSVAHDVLVKAILKATSEEHAIRTSFRAYVQRAIRNQLIDLGTGRRWHVEALDDALVCDEPSELENLIEAQFETLVRAKVDALPRDAREILHLRFERDLSYAEIATLLGLASEDAARMRVNRVIERLRDELAAAA